jgi:5-methyltetrahydrofolate--homocysteine methyltransferase
MPEPLQAIGDAVVAGDIDRMQELTQQCLDSGASAEEVLANGLLVGMGVVGQRFKECEMFIPEVIRSAKAMHEALAVIRPLLSSGSAPNAGRVVIGTVEGDLHDIGKNLVTMMLQGAGFEVFDLGVDKGPQVFVQAIEEHGPDIIGLSALLTTTMPKMAQTITAIEAAGLRDKVKIMVGGAPVTQQYAEEIGADAYGDDATATVEVAKALLGTPKG